MAMHLSRRVDTRREGTANEEETTESARQIRWSGGLTGIGCFTGQLGNHPALFAPWPLLSFALSFSDSVMKPRGTSSRIPRPRFSICRNARYRLLPYWTTIFHLFLSLLSGFLSQKSGLHTHTHTKFS